MKIELYLVSYQLVYYFNDIKVKQQQTVNKTDGVNERHGQPLRKTERKLIVSICSI